MFLVSMADIIGSYERSRRCENNDAVRAVAVAKRREYVEIGSWVAVAKLDVHRMIFWH